MAATATATPGIKFARTGSGRTTARCRCFIAADPTTAPCREPAARRPNQRRRVAVAVTTTTCPPGLLVSVPLRISIVDIRNELAAIRSALFTSSAAPSTSTTASACTTAQPPLPHGSLLRLPRRHAGVSLDELRDAP
ncbi:hypothetical protein HK405_006002, partial [Cladochytrium tenue]